MYKVASAGVAAARAVLLHFVFARQRISSDRAVSCTDCQQCQAVEWQHTSSLLNQRRPKLPQHRGKDK